MGLNYIIAAVSLFDEYVNDLLYLREGTCLPRYRVVDLFPYCFISKILIFGFSIQHWLITNL